MNIIIITIYYRWKNPIKTKNLQVVSWPIRKVTAYVGVRIRDRSKTGAHGRVTIRVSQESSKRGGTTFSTRVALSMKSGFLFRGRKRRGRMLLSDHQ